MTERIQLLGRITIQAEIKARSGLAIGAGEHAFGLGADRGVVRDSTTGEPYIPGSSLKGKLRALTERALGAPLLPAAHGGSRREARLMHRCASEKEYKLGASLEGYAGCSICHLYGIIPTDFSVYPTRLITRDAPLSQESREFLAGKRTDLPFTEVKTESALDRFTAAATPRLRERVPAGAVFDAQWVLSCYAVGDTDLHDELLLGPLLAALSLLQGDYLGGQGSRGYGQVEIAGLKVATSHDGGLSDSARELLEQLADADGLAGALEVTGNPLVRSGT